MATLTYDEAADAIQDRFKVQWDADSAAVAGSVPPVEWDNLEALDPPPSTWVRVKVEHTLGRQSSLGETGNRLFDREGLVTVQVFAPHGQGVTLARQLASIVVNAFEGKTAGPDEQIWFRNVRMNELGPTDKWFQVNVLSEFMYSTLK